MKTALLINFLFCIYAAHTFDAERRFLRQQRLAELANERSGVQVMRPKRQSPSDEKRIVCFFASWAVLRDGPNVFTPEDIDSRLCTHLIYGYARPELKEGIVPYDTKPDIEQNLWQRFVDIKKTNRDVKLLLGVGGIIEGSARFSKIVADRKERQIFVKSASTIMKEYGFDGLEMSWVYPGFSEGSSPSDKQNYAILIKELRQELGNNYLLTATVPGLDKLIDAGYDFPEILKYLDFLNIWAGAYHSSTDPVVNHPSPLYNFPVMESTKFDNVDATFNSLFRRGIPGTKMNLLIANFGTYFELEDEKQTDIGSPTEDEGENMEWRGGLNYNDLCTRVIVDNWTVVKVNSSALGPYAYKGKEWVAWDDEVIIRNKALYALEKKIGGVGFWTIDMDDFRGICHTEKFPLLKAAREAFLQSPTTSESIRKENTYMARPAVIEAISRAKAQFKV